jgi:hypothetical protein
MTQDEIIEMARQADWPDSLVAPIIMAKLSDFAKLVAAKERKEICGTIQQIVPITSWAHELLEAIRARGEQA